jgi:uncharacterized iron-regulated membrane protein
MNWFRKHVRTGARLALLALAIQFVLSFGHFHAFAAQAAPAVQAGLTQADPGHVAISPARDAGAQKQQPSNHDRDHPSDGCAICAVIALATNLLLATPPALKLPQAIELPYLTSEAEFAHLKSAPHAFQSRAPPLS